MPVSSLAGKGEWCAGNLAAAMQAGFSRQAEGWLVVLVYTRHPAAT